MTGSSSIPDRPHPGTTRARRRPFVDVPGPDCAEVELDAYVRELAALHGWLTYHVLRPQRGPPGFPDRVLSRGDVFAIVELKRALGRHGGRTRSSGAGVDPTGPQAAWLDAAARARWIVSALWRPGDVEGIAAFLAGADVEPPGLWNPDVARETRTPGGLVVPGAGRPVNRA